jgi:hypothetical protein
MLRGQGDDAFRAHWLAMPIETFTAGIDPSDLAPLRVRLDTADPSDRPIDVVVESTGIRTELHASGTPDVAVTGDPGVIFQTMLGQRDDAVAGISPGATRRFVELTRRIAAAHS